MFPQKQFQQEVRYERDFDSTHTVAKDALLANTTKELTVPAGAIGIHLWNDATTPVYCKLDAAWAGAPGAVAGAGGMFPPVQASARYFSRDGIAAGHTLNLICAGAANFAYEWLMEKV